MPDISKFKSVSVSTDTHDKLVTLAQKRFEVPVSVQKVIEFLLEKELKKIPFFVRGKARRNTEIYAAAKGVREISVDTLYEAKAHYAN